MLNAFRYLKAPQIMAFQRSSPLLFRSFRPLMRVKMDFNVILKLMKGQKP